MKTKKLRNNWPEEAKHEAEMFELAFAKQLSEKLIEILVITISNPF